MTIPEEKTLRSFVFEKVLNQDTRSKSINLLGSILSKPAIIIAEKTAFDVAPSLLESFPGTDHLSSVFLMERNDIYHWFLASRAQGSLPVDAEVKLTLIYPATETHIRKYSQQQLRMVKETPEVYKELVKPYVDKKRSDGRLNWVYNILEHRAETDRIIIEDEDLSNGFILLPDLKWDRKTMSSMYTMAVVHRRDITSLRDLKRSDAPWLRRVQQKITEGLCKTYPEIEEDQIKIYLHYQPSYYHFHLHAISISHDGGLGQATGKAWLLGNVISLLEAMATDHSGFADIELIYFLGEESELWQNVFSKTKTSN